MLIFLYFLEYIFHNFAYFNRFADLLLDILKVEIIIRSYGIYSTFTACGSVFIPLEQVD